MGKMMRKLEIGAVPHGFRSSFRDWAAECTEAPREVSEFALVSQSHRPGLGPTR